jgi:hypothetical protein
MFENVKFMTHQLERIDQILTFLLVINKIADELIKTETTPTYYLPKWSRSSFTVYLFKNIC